MCVCVEWDGECVYVLSGRESVCVCIEWKGVCVCMC